MIFQADFGDIDQALTHADTLLALESRRAELTPFLRTRLNVALCYRRGGRIAEAKALARGTYDFARHHGLASHAAWAAMSLAYIALQEEDYSNTRVWHTRAASHLRSIDDKSCRDSLDYIRTRIALHEGDLEPVQAFLDDFRDGYANGTMLQRQCYASLRSEMALARNEPMDRNEVDVHTKDFQKSWEMGFHDFFAFSVYRALAAVGEEPRGKDLLVDYATSRRRDRGPLMPSLRTLVEKLRIQPRPLAKRGERVSGMAPTSLPRGAAR